MSLGRGNFGGGLTRGGDDAALRSQIAQAPHIPHLRRRVVALFAPYRWRLVVTALLVGASAAIGVLPALVIEQIFDDALFPPSGEVDTPLLIRLSVAIVLMFTLASALNITQTWLTATVGNRVTGDLRVSLFRHLHAMDIGFFTRTKTGVIQSRLQNDVGGVATVLTNTLTTILGNGVTVITCLVAMAIINWRLTIVAVILLPPLAIAQRQVGRVRARVAARAQESLSELTAMTQESLSVSGMMLAKVFHLGRREIEEYEKETDRQVALQIGQSMSGQAFFAVVNVVMSSVPAVIYVMAGFFLTGGVDLTAGAVVAFTAVQARLVFPLTALMRVTLDVQTSMALFARIFEYLDLVPAITDPAQPVDLPRRVGAGRVEFRDVTFRYPGTAADAPPTLQDVSFVAEPGQHIAFVGTSGAGKTSTLYLIPRLYDVAEGAVLVDGVDVRMTRQSDLIERVGLVSQETFLFHASLRDNLRYAKPDATDDEIRHACRGAHIDHVIESFPEGYDTVVGERGYRLSGGEKQRIAIARVLLKNPPILILDEATSALDTVSEKIVQQALDDASRGRTTLTVAHRLSTVIGADVIHVVDHGRIVESGSHRDLLAAGGAYARLVERQRQAAPALAHSRG